MPYALTNKLQSWASDIEAGTIDQAQRTSRLAAVAGHVALMPDAHVGIGATVGSVIPTTDAIIPAAVGVDIGCGMIAVRTTLEAGELPEDLDRFLPLVERAVPAGLGRWHSNATDASRSWFATHPPARPLAQDLEARALNQFGTLGSGNHFFRGLPRRTRRRVGRPALGITGGGQPARHRAHRHRPRAGGGAGGAAGGP